MIYNDSIIKLSSYIKIKLDNCIFIDAFNDFKNGLVPVEFVLGDEDDYIYSVIDSLKLKIQEDKKKILT